MSRSTLPCVFRGPSPDRAILSRNPERTSIPPRRTPDDEPAAQGHLLNGLIRRLPAVEQERHGLGADLVLIAADTGVDCVRFAGKRRYATNTKAAIHDGKA